MAPSGQATQAMADVTEILLEGYQGAAQVTRTLMAIANLTTEEAADFCRVAPETFRRWLRDRPVPAGAVRLLAIRAGFCPWPGWEKFFHCGTDGKLYHQDLRYGFAPSDLIQLHWMRQELDAVRAENQRLRLELQDTAQPSAASVAVNPSNQSDPETGSAPPSSQPLRPASPDRYSGQSLAAVIPFPRPGAPADPVGLPAAPDRTLQQQGARHVLRHLRHWLVRGNRT